MRRIISLLLMIAIFLSSICGIAYAVTYNVRSLVTSAAIAAGGLITCPANVTSSAYGARAIALAIPQARMAKIITSVAALGAGLAMGYAMDQLTAYIASKNDYRVTTDGIQYNDYAPSSPLYAGDITTPVTGMYTSLGPADTYVYVFPTSAIAYAKMQVMIAAYGVAYSTPSNAYSGAGSGSISPPSSGARCWVNTVLAGFYQNTTQPVAGRYKQIISLYPTNANNGLRFTTNRVWTNIGTGSAEIATLEGLITTDLNNSVAGAISAAWQAIRAAAYGLDHPSSGLGVSSSMPRIQTELDSSVTADQKGLVDVTNKAADEYANTIPTSAGTVPEKTISGDDVKNAVISALIAQGLSNTQIQAAVSAALQANSNLFNPGGGGGGITETQMQGIIDGLIAVGLSPADVTTAVKSALNDETGVDTTPEPSFVNPEKLSLTSILGSFMNSVRNLPIFATLQGISLTASGSSVLCIDLSSNYGGQRCWDASSIQSQLSTVGSAILAIVAMISVIGIFRG